MNGLLLSPTGGLQVIPGSGNLFRKQILRYGRWIHPSDSNSFMQITREMANTMVKNFRNNIPSDYVPTPAGHTDDATQNKGKIVDLSAEDDGVYTIMQFDEATSNKARAGTIPGVSAAIHFNYRHKQTGEELGPVITHVALVNEPYIKGLRTFQPITLSENKFEVLQFSEATTMTKEELIAALKKDHSIDVVTLQADAATLVTTKVSLTEAITAKTAAETQVAALKGEKVSLTEQVTTLSAAKPDVAKLTEQVSSLTTTNATLLSEKNAAELKVVEMEKKNNLTEVTATVTALLSEGRLAPASKEQFIKLGVKDRTSFDAMVSTLPKVVDLSERGTHTTGGPVGGMDAQQANVHIERIKKEYGLGARKVS